MKKRFEPVERLIADKARFYSNNKREEPQHRLERNKEQESVTMLRLRHQQKRKCDQQDECRRNSPPAKMNVTHHH